MKTPRFHEQKKSTLYFGKKKTPRVNKRKISPRIHEKIKTHRFHDMKKTPRFTRRKKLTRFREKKKTTAGVYDMMCTTANLHAQDFFCTCFWQSSESIIKSEKSKTA